MKQVEAALAESFRIRSQLRMPFVILDTQGKPLADAARHLILIGSEAEARKFVMPGDQGVVRWDWWVAQNGEEST